jgi:PAS domain S-box-containing protein
VSDKLAFLAGGGEAARQIRARNWSDHPLGRPETWPVELRTALSLVLNSPESMILAWGPELHFFFNDAYAPLLGPRLAWAMGERFDVVWADAWDQAKPIIDDAFAGRSRRFDNLPWKLGTDRGPAETWFSFSYSRVLDGEGRVTGLFVLTNETTARVLADRALRESEEHYRQTVELNPQVPWTCDPQGNITSYSHRWLELTGQAPGEPDGTGWTKALHPDDLEPTAAVFAARLGSGEPVDVDYRIRIAATGEYRWQRARAYPRRDAAGTVTLVRRRRGRVRPQARRGGPARERGVAPRRRERPGPRHPHHRHGRRHHALVGRRAGGAGLVARGGGRAASRHHVHPRGPRAGCRPPGDSHGGPRGLRHRRALARHQRWPARLPERLGSPAAA